jgi:D-sedoheptulose 7-phosphate isomerase
MKQSGDFEARIRKSIKSSIDAQQNLLADANAMAEIVKVCGAIVAAFRQGNKVLLFGNGGSAADAQHIAADLVGRFAFNRAALAAIALGVNGSSLTAIGNDYGFEQVFARQVEALGRAGDVAVGISTSGNSANVLQGLATAKKNGLVTVALTGKAGGKLKGFECVDSCISAPADETPRIQECHILIGHVICEMVEQELFG